MKLCKRSIGIISSECLFLYVSRRRAGISLLSAQRGTLAVQSALSTINSSRAHFLIIGRVKLKCFALIRYIDRLINNTLTLLCLTNIRMHNCVVLTRRVNVPLT